MSRWWYYTIHKCPDCGRTYEEYDGTAPWCNSGLSSCPTVKEFCDDCFEDRRQADLEEEAAQQ
jgi:hypothetical protein